jgi:hypothetical protein
MAMAPRHRVAAVARLAHAVQGGELFTERLRPTQECSCYVGASAHPLKQGVAC